MEIKVDGICFAYGRRRVLHDVDWELRPGVTGLLGENGSGKTTLLSVLIGLLAPSEGTVTVDKGRTSGALRVVGDSEELRFGFVQQRFSLPGHMRVADVVAYSAWVHGVPRQECASVADKAVASVALEDKARVRVRELSGGQRQRLGIAAELAHDPDVLVLDEPTVGLDASQRSRVRDLIAEVGQTRPVVMSTHLLDDVSYICERVGVLARGRLVFDGLVTDLERSGAGGAGDVDARRSPLEQGYERLLESVGGIE